jgi:alpha-D-ribose 1-methylphosphonate 5-triphosphate diphosphatase PhnM
VHGSARWRWTAGWNRKAPPFSNLDACLAVQAKASRHHIPRQQHKVTNWPAYEAGLRQRGSLTVWFTDEAVAAWAAEPRTTRGG